jgi:integrin alpha FG-GAP repeat containing protein 1
LQYRAFVMWGDHKQSDGKHSLICLEKSLEQGWHHKFNTSHHPINIDANGDYVTDLFGVPQNQTISSRGVWTFSSSRKDPPKLSYLMGRDLGPMKKPHSNSFVDLDGDGNADLIVTSEDYFELWHNDGKKESDNGSFVHIKNIKLPADCKPSQDTCAVGQLAFSDFDLDGKLDLVFPVCHDGKDCSNSTMYFTTTKKLWFANKDDDNVFTPMTIDLRTWRFHFLEDPIYSALAPRIGDINLDGYPDLLVRMKNPSTSTYQTHLLLNVVVDAGDEIIISNLKRGFLLQDKIMEGIPDSVMATFYDLYENGIEDMILVQKLDDDKYRIGAFTNLTQDSDAYFVKVIVLSGT